MSEVGGHVPKTARGEQTRQRLLEAAERVFGARGYHAASIVDITRDAGVAMGTFYIYFRDKRAIFEELVRHLNRSLRQHLRGAVAAAPDRLGSERAGFLAFFAFIEQHRNLYRIIRQAEFVDEALYQWHYRTLAQGYARGLAEAMAHGEMRRLDPETVAYCLMAIAESLGMRWSLWAGTPPPQAAIDTAMDLIARGLVADPADDGRVAPACFVDPVADGAAPQAVGGREAEPPATPTASAAIIAPAGQPAAGERSATGQPATGERTA